MYCPKVAILDENGKIEKIIIFDGKPKSLESKKREIFSETELTNFANENINIEFSEDKIYKDDSIYTIKLKIINEFKKKIAFEEIYIFGKSKVNVNLYKMFVDITNNDAGLLSPLQFAQLLANLEVDPNSVEASEKYSYEELYKTGIHNTERELFISLGQRFSSKLDPIFSINPYTMLPSPAPAYQSKSDNPILNLENQLLLKYGTLTMDMIYLVKAEHLFSHAIRHNIPEDHAIMYFPFLVKKNITTFSEFKKKKQELLRNNDNLISKKTLKLFSTIDFFHDVYDQRKTDLEYAEKGIKSYMLALHPNVKYIMPLDSIFKNLHATKGIPFIKYNPGSRRESIYRFYSEKMTKTGNKIPFLEKNVIMNWSKQIGKPKQISLCVQYERDGIKYDIFIDILENGNINITGTLAVAISYELLNEILYENVNPIIQNINGILYESGYQIHEFKSIRDKNIEVLDLKYTFSCKIKEKININKMNCIYAIFDVINGANISNGIVMRFKRVHNYSKMDSQNELITEVLNRTNDEVQVIASLIRNFDMTEEDAVAYYQKFKENVIQLHGEFTNKRLELPDNPGFPITMEIPTLSMNVLNVNIFNIISFEYIEILETYIDSFIRISQFPETTKISVATINKMCKNIKNNDLEMAHIDNIVAIENIEIFKHAFTENEEEENAEDNANFQEFDDNIIQLHQEFEESPEPQLESREEPQLESREEPELEFHEEPELEFHEEPELEFHEEPELEFHEEPELESREELELESREEPEVMPQVSSNASQEEEKSAETPEGMYFEESDEETPNESNEAPLQEIEEEPEGIYFEDEDESESSQSNDSTNKGGKPPTESNLDGTKISNEKLFLSKMKKLDSALFINKKSGKYDSYSRICPANSKLQPIILTDEEKRKIDNDHAGSYGRAIKYGTDPNKKHWFICPRYWSILTNTSLTQAQVDSGEYGKIISPNDKVIKPGHYIYEFNENKYHQSKNNKYVKHYPGFKKKDSHPKGYCMPCCFNNWSSVPQIERRQQCLANNADVYEEPDYDGKEDEDEEVYEKPKMQKTIKRKLKTQKNKTLSIKEIIDKESQTSEKSKTPVVVGKRQKGRPKKQLPKDMITYIIANDKNPKPGRYGFLPVEVQLFLQNNASDATTRDNDALIKPNTPVLLRYGVEKSDNQSFIACISEIYASYRKLEKSPSIQEMKEIIVNAMSLDKYIKYHNGMLISSFIPHAIEIENIDVEKYNETKIYSMINLENKNQLYTFKKAIASFENFQKFLQNDTTIIDHTYLWDIVSTPDPLLLPDGINMAILELSNKDITNNIELICPSNAYSNLFYDPTKETIILLKSEHNYEPIYMYENRVSEIVFKKRFAQQNSPENIVRILQIIQNTTKKYCIPNPSIRDNQIVANRIFKFKKNISAYEVVALLTKYEYVIHTQVINYQMKTIGFVISIHDETSNSSVFIPCFPSAILELNRDVHIENVFMDNPRLWKNYETTRDLLQEVHTNTGGKIRCAPSVKIIDDGYIVGLLTETNQFVQITPPVIDTYDDNIPSVNNSNYIVADKEITSSNQEDILRKEMIKMIELESQFYSIFRSTLRLLLGQYENHEIRSNIISVINDPKIYYQDKLKMLEKNLKKLTKDSIQFVEFDHDVLMSFKDITSCNTGNCANVKYCMTTASNQCKLLIPDKHLIKTIQNKDKIIENEKLYFNKMADELVRYKRVQQFMLKNKTFLNLSKSEYKINNDEMIILHSLLTSENLDYKPYDIQNISYDNAVPNIRTKYSNKVSLVEQNNMVSENHPNENVNKYAVECVEKTRDVEGNKTNIWKRRFPRSAREIVCFTNINCTFYPIIHILNEKANAIDRIGNFSILNVKETLVNSYSKYLPGHLDHILSVLKKQGKKEIVNNIVSKKYTFQQAIMNADYYITTLDLWVLAQDPQYNLPIIIFTTNASKLKSINGTIDWLKLGGNPGDKYYFIRSPTEYVGSYIPKFQMITPAYRINDLRSSAEDSFKDDFRKSISTHSDNVMSLENYLQNYEG